MLNQLTMVHGGGGGCNGYRKPCDNLLPCCAGMSCENVNQFMPEVRCVKPGDYTANPNGDATAKMDVGKAVASFLGRTLDEEKW